MRVDMADRTPPSRVAVEVGMTGVEVALVRMQRQVGMRDRGA